MYKVAILNIGDEILIGQTINTNAAWLGNEITTVGAKVICHSSIADNKSIILSELERLNTISDLVIITGGLGPTHDDITKQTLVEYFKDELYLNDEILENLVRFYKLRGRELTEINKQTAYLPKQCKILSNKVGTAPGMLFSNGSTSFISLPGVPGEMKSIFKDYISDFIKNEIQQKQGSIVSYISIQTSGIPETLIAEKLPHADDFLKTGYSLAYLPSYRGVKLRIGIEENSFELASEKLELFLNYIQSQISDYITSVGNQSTMEYLADILRNKQLTVSVAESCTGGMLGAALTDLAGSSEFFTGGELTYSNEAKIKQLGVKPETIEQFGAVSEETALEMCQNIQAKHSTDIGVSITGIAGPGGGNEEKPVGTVWIGIAFKEKSYAKKFVFSKDRQVNRELSVGYAISELIRLLK